MACGDVRHISIQHTQTASTTAPLELQLQQRYQRSTALRYITSSSDASRFVVAPRHSLACLASHTRDTSAHVTATLDSTVTRAVVVGLHFDRIASGRQVAGGGSLFIDAWRAVDSRTSPKVATFPPSEPSLRRLFPLLTAHHGVHV